MFSITACHCSGVKAECPAASLRVKPGERYSIVRFVRWKAAHDVGLAGYSDAQKRSVVRALADQHRPLTITEVEAPDLAAVIQRGFPFDPAVLDLPDDTYLDGYFQSE